MGHKEPLRTEQVGMGAGFHLRRAPVELEHGGIVLGKGFCRGIGSYVILRFPKPRGGNLWSHD